jgi:AraC family transcriptional regulator
MVFVTDSRSNPAAADGQSFAVQADAYPAGTRHRPHHHDVLHFSIVLGGHVTEVVGQAAEFAGALSVVAKDPGVVHANEFGPGGARLARLTMPAGTFASFLDDPTRFSGWHWTHDPAVAASFLKLVRRAERSTDRFETTDPDLLDLLAAFTARRAGPAHGVPPGWLNAIMQEVREGWHPTLTASSLARRAGVHPVYLARCVRRWFATSIGAELRRQRLRVAASGIADGRRTISTVAQDCGFADEPHLNRAFRGVTGMTPGRFRTLVRKRDYTWRSIG